VELVEDRDPPALIWSIAAPVGPATQFTGHATAYLVRMLQAHRGRRWRPLRVLCAIPEPALAGRHRVGLGCPILFDAPLNAIEIAAADLRAEKADVDPRLHALLVTYAEALLAQQPAAPADLEDAVRLALRDGLALGRTDLDFVASRLRLSRRSLQRALAGRGLRFAGLRQAERLDLACVLLGHHAQPIGEIAARLGYAETAAFSRAFRRRFGVSPRSARRRADGDDPATDRGGL
jgi:AraC-like DNA-binding protein